MLRAGEKKTCYRSNYGQRLIKKASENKKTEAGNSENPMG